MSDELLTGANLGYLAAIAAVTLAGAVVARGRCTLPCGFFIAGMLLLAADSALGSVAARAGVTPAGLGWQRWQLVVKSLQPVVWLAFSLSYSRGNGMNFLRRWRPGLTAALVVPLTVLAAGWADVLNLHRPVEPWATVVIQTGALGRALHLVLLGACVLILVNLERTFRAAVGTMRWRLKYMVLGVAAVFGAQIFTYSQSLLYPVVSGNAAIIGAAALLLGCAGMGVAWWREGFSEVDVYPPEKATGTSITVLLVGSYLIVVGLLAQVVEWLGGIGSLEAQSFLTLLVVVGLAAVLLSERLRLGLRRFISRTFGRTEYDFRRVWTEMTACVSAARDERALCSGACRLFSETFNALSVSAWLANDVARRMEQCASTSRTVGQPGGNAGDRLPAPAELDSVLRGRERPFSIEAVADDWAVALKAAGESQFRTGGDRVLVPLRAAGRLLGFLLMADRVNGRPYSEEEMDLLKGMGDQMAAAMLNLRLASDLTAAREMEAFQSMSTFFVHDLKNAASTLNLMLKNLPVHFDDPEFRKDALRGIGSTVERINQLIARLGTLRGQMEIKRAPVDWNAVVNEALAGVRVSPDIQLQARLGEVPPVPADREKLLSVFANLVVNATEALNGPGRIEVVSLVRDGHAVLSVADNGCGMSAEFVRGDLFRPFRTTKKKGLGIGMFQSRMIVEAHNGRMEVQSEPGAGTTVEVWMPIKL